MGTADNLSVPNSALPTNDGSMIITAPVGEMWKRCANALDPAALNIPEFKRGFDRLRLREGVVELESRVTREMTSNAVIENEQRACELSNVNTIQQAADSAQLAAVGSTFDLVIESHQQRVVGAPLPIGGLFSEREVFATADRSKYPRGVA